MYIYIYIYICLCSNLQLNKLKRSNLQCKGSSVFYMTPELKSHKIRLFLKMFVCL